MKEIIEQFIIQIEQDQKLSPNTKSAYKSDLNDFLEYIFSTNTKLANINKEWVRNYLKYLENVNREKNSFNRRSSTFRIFLRFLYKNKLLPTNYSLIVNNHSAFVKSKEKELQDEDIEKIIEYGQLNLINKLILNLLGKVGLSATQIVSLNTFQVDFENKTLQLSDSQKVVLPDNLFFLLREYILDIRPKMLNSDSCLSLFLSDRGKPLHEQDVYKLVKKISYDFSLQGKLTTRELKSFSRKNIDVFSMQKEILEAISFQKSSE